MSRELDEYHLCVNASNDLLGEKEKLGDEQARSQAQLPQLYTLLRHGQNLKSLVLALVMIDLAAMPITYYYALRYGTDMTLRQVIAMVAVVFGFVNFTHHSVRSLKLLRSKSSTLVRPIGWTKWGIMEFLQLNILVIIALVEAELIFGSMLGHSWMRLCAMPPATILIYLGTLSCGSAILTSLGMRLPFNMSSTAKGQTWRPVLLAFIEDAGAIEGGGEVEFRQAVMRRWELSPQFRSLIMSLSWILGIGYIFIGVFSAALIMMSKEDIGFGIGWGLPWACAVVQTCTAIPFVKSRLREETSAWRTKDVLGVEKLAIKPV